jgi:hypothetical protein
MAAADIMWMPRVVVHVRSADLNIAPFYWPAAMLTINNSSLIGAFRSPRRLQFQALSYLGAETRAEVGSLDPHAMQNASELTGAGNDRAQHVRPLRDPKTRLVFARTEWHQSGSGRKMKVTQSRP